MHKRIKSSNYFEYITALPSANTKQSVQNLPEADLKETFNRLFNENVVKQRKLEHLKQIVDSVKAGYSEAVSVHKHEQLAQLVKNIESKEEICMEEVAEQAVLAHKKETLKLQTEKIRGQVIELQKNFERITTNYSAFNNSNFASKYSMIMTNRELGEYAKHFDSSNNLFAVNVEKLEKRLKTASDANLKRIKKNSSLDLQFEAKKREKKEFCKNYENCLKDLFSLTQNKKASLDLLKSYKKGFLVIKSFLNEETLRSDSHPKTVQAIISKLKELEYRSESLNLTYQKMSEQEARLTQDLSFLKNDLMKARLLLQEDPKNLKIFEDKQLNTTRSHENQLMIIKFYFQITEVLFENYEKLSLIKNLEKDIEEKAKDNLHLIKLTRIGLQKRKPFNIERFIIEKIVGRHSYFETRMEILNSISLSSSEIKSIYLKIIPNSEKDCKIFTSFIENSPILKIFLDKETLVTFLRENQSKVLKDLLNDLAEGCEFQLMERFKNIVNLSLDFFTLLRSKCDSVFLSSKSLLKLSLSIPTHHKSRSLSSSPYKVTEKTHKKPLEKEKSELPVKETPPLATNNVPRVYSLPLASINRQKVMKEVLENQKKEMLLRTIEKKISKNSLKSTQLPYMKKFVLRNSSSDRITSQKTFLSKKLIN